MKNKTNNNFEILRWIALVPAVCFAWYISAMFFAWLSHFFYSPTIWNSYGDVFVTTELLILPTIVVFFVSRFVTPKYKKHVGYIAIALCVLWFIFFIYGLGHMAY